MAYRTAYAAAVEAITKLANDLAPLLRSAAEGEFVVSQARIQAVVNSKISQVNDLEALEVLCEPDGLRLVAQCKKWPGAYEVSFRAIISELKVGADRQVAEFRFDEQCDVVGQNMAGKLTALFAHAAISNLVASSETSDKVNEKTDGLVDLVWPDVRVHLDKHPLVVRASDLRAGNFSFWDLVEVTGCRVEQGRIVLLIESRALNKLKNMKAAQ